MKLKTLAAAIAVASMPFAAQAAGSISGDIGVGYFVNGAGDGSFNESGSEINVGASEKIGALTYFGHLEMDIQGDGGAPNVSFEELRVGVKGAFGEVRVGSLGDPGCGMVQTGGSYEIWKTHSKGGCGGLAQGISFKKSFGRLTGAITYSPGSDASTATSTATTYVATDTTNAATGIVATQIGATGVFEQVTTTTTTTAGVDDQISVGLSGKVGPVTASIGHTTGIDRTAFAVRGTIGPVEAGMRYGKSDGSDAEHGFNLLYKTAGGLNIYGGLETGSTDGDEGMSFGVKKVVGKTDFAFEAHDDGTSNDNVSYVVGMRHRF